MADLNVCYFARNIFDNGVIYEIKSSYKNVPKLVKHGIVAIC